MHKTHIFALCFCKHECYFVSWGTRRTCADSVNLQTPTGYLRRISGYKEGVGPPRVVVVVHRRCYVEGHELQRGDVPGQAAVAVVWNGAAFGGGVRYPARRDPAVGICSAKTNGTDDSFVCVSYFDLPISTHRMTPSCISPETSNQPLTILPVTDIPPVSLPVTCSLCICWKPGMGRVVRYQTAWSTSAAWTRLWSATETSFSMMGRA